MKNRPSEPRVDAMAAIPAWLPGGTRWDRLAPEFKAPARDLLVPAYRQLVLELGNLSKRAAGLILMQLSWPEARTPSPPQMGMGTTILKWKNRNPLTKTQSTQQATRSTR